MYLQIFCGLNLTCKIFKNLNVLLLNSQWFFCRDRDLFFLVCFFFFFVLLSPTRLISVVLCSEVEKISRLHVRYTLEILHSRRWELAGGDWAGPSGDVAGSLAARCSARSRRRHLDSSSRWRLAFANKLLAAAACLLSLCLQKRLGSVDLLC